MTTTAAGTTASTTSPRRSFWAWCLESEEPTDAERAELARSLSQRAGTAITAAPVPSLADAQLRRPRTAIPDALAGWCTTDTWERAFHAYGAHFTDRTRAFYGMYVDMEELRAEGDKMVGDDIAEEGIKYLQEINFKDRIAGAVKIAAE